MGLGQGRGVGFGLALLLAACAPQGELGPRPEPSGLVTPLPNGDFDGYIVHAKAQISGLEPIAGNAPGAVADRAPFELVPDRERCARTAEGRWPRAALLIHGIGDVPYRLRDVGAALRDACYLVRAILLPGHGTVPGDLLDIDHRRWLEATRAGVASFAGVADEVFLVGFSGGGTLALHYALYGRPPEGIGLGGLVLLAPALERGLQSQDLLGPWLANARALETQLDADPLAYDALARNAKVQLDRVVGEVAAHEGPLELPTFMVLSAEDATIDARAALGWFCRKLSGPRRLIWYSRTAEPVSGCRFVTVRASGQAESILNYAHIALPTSPDNPRYGSGGAYVDCRHYYDELDTPRWLICADRSRTPANAAIRYGEVPSSDSNGMIVRRLTYNPDFEQMLDDMLAFLGDLE